MVEDSWVNLVTACFPCNRVKGNRTPEEEGIRNFWKWFGDSKVVDDQDRPLVVYHGSKSDIKKFKTDVLGSSTGASSATKGFFFTDSIENSERYAYYIASASSEYKEKLLF